MKKYALLFPLALLLIAGPLLAQNETLSKKTPAIIPYPSHLDISSGTFVITRNTTLTIPADGKYRNEANFLSRFITQSLNKKLLIKKTKGRHSIELIYDASLTAPEAYRLVIRSDRVTVLANDAAGMFHAMETIRQLLPVSVEEGKASRELRLPALTINDAPAYAWRGMHLDVSRHFFSVSYLKKFIDVLALYKMNKLHLHLTDDQGWRIEIKKYPKLTQEGAWRTFSNLDSACMVRAKTNPDFVIDKEHIIKRNGKTLYGGFYTRQQMKNVVAYAAARHIDIIPEIDMPGHMMAAINSYPFLTCNGESKWGKDFTTPVCPCNETTFDFAENVFSEIMEIFPSQYIHIGGDEVDRSEWGKSEACKALMKREGIKDLPALQSYFIDRMEKFFNSKGRKLIGWDEILEGGISPTAIVMYWRTWVHDAPFKAVKNGNKVIMSPGSPLYFDHPADKNSISDVYHFNPIPAGLDADEGRSIIGAQANIWTEYIPSEKRADYMYMPRMTALAELLWINNADDYGTYLTRLNEQYPRLDALKINYRLPDLDNIVETQVFTDNTTLDIKPPLPGYVVRYTTDGTLPDQASPFITGKLIIDRSVHFKVAAFTSHGRRGDVYDLDYEKQELAQPVQPGKVQPGLLADYYGSFFKQTTAISGTKPDSSLIVANISVPDIKAPAFGIKYRGYIEIPMDGVYTFYLTADDGAVLKIADRIAVDNDGLHSAIEKNGQAALKKGLHPFALDFIEGGGGFVLKLKYSFNGSLPAKIPESWWKH